MSCPYTGSKHVLESDALFVSRASLIKQLGNPTNAWYKRSVRLLFLKRTEESAENEVG